MNKDYAEVSRGARARACVRGNTGCEQKTSKEALFCHDVIAPRVRGEITACM